MLPRRVELVAFLLWTLWFGSVSLEKDGYSGGGEDAIGRAIESLSSGFRITRVAVVCKMGGMAQRRLFMKNKGKLAQRKSS